MDAFIHALATYSLQMLVIVAAAACGLLIVRARAPQFRLIAWRAILLVCLLLPLAPPRVVDVDSAGDADISVTVAEPATAAVERGTLAAAVIWLVSAGAVARAFWLLVGLVRLRTLRADGVIAVLADDLAVMHRTLAPMADVRWHDRLPQPVTFGLRRPVVLLPSRLRQLPADLQRAVLCHELLHASRGDWRATLCEEMVKTVFWFHPGIWWVIGQIQLCREEIVDALAVSITASRRLYMRALLAFAESPPAPPMLAPLFAHRRHLAVRIRQLSQEVVMSRTRVVLSAAALLVLIAASGWTVVSALPVRTEMRLKPLHQTGTDVTLPAAARAIVDASQRITPPPATSTRPAPPLPPPPPPPPAPPDVKTNLRVLSKTKPDYPREALPHGVAASVWVTLTIDATGQVVEAKASRFQLTIDRSIDDPNYWASKPERPFMEAAETAAMRWKFEPDANRPISVELLFTFRTVPGPEKMLEKVLALSPGIPAAGNVLDSPAQGGPRVLRVGWEVKPPQKIFDVKPVYPETARAQNVQGVVILELRIGADGSIVDARVLRSIPLLDDAALAAARQWKFTPTLMNGEPVEVVMNATINFSLP
jgi:TonB family protein